MEASAAPTVPASLPEPPWWSTTDVALADRTDAWEAALSDNFRRWQVPDRVAPEFNARLRHRDVAGLRVVECLCDPCGGRRLPRHVSQEGAAYIGVQITRSGRESLRAGDERVAVGPGDLVIWTSDQPMEFTVTERLHKVSLILPWDDVKERLPRTGRFRGTVLDSRSGIGAVLYSHIESLASQLEELEAGELSAVRRATVELLTAAMSCRLEPAPRGLSLQQLKRVQDYILDHLQDETLTPGSIAQAHHISPRYLHLLFGKTGQSVSAYIRQQRLERCGEALSNPSYREHSVAEIAYQWGFTDPAHFSRVFKQHFGHPPGHCRR